MTVRELIEALVDLGEENQDKDVLLRGSGPVEDADLCFGGVLLEAEG